MQAEQCWIFAREVAFASSFAVLSLIAASQVPLQESRSRKKMIVRYVAAPANVGVQIQKVWEA